MAFLVSSSPARRRCPRHVCHPRVHVSEPTLSKSRDLLLECLIHQCLPRASFVSHSYVHSHDILLFFRKPTLPSCYVCASHPRSLKSGPTDIKGRFYHYHGIHTNCLRLNLSWRSRTSKCCRTFPNRNLPESELIFDTTAESKPTADAPRSHSGAVKA